MCTLIAAFDPAALFPLMVAANRDEHLDRPSSPPRLWPGPPAFVAPCDERAGGTWLGLNSRGLFVGITNRFGASPDPHRTSRGQLVVDALRSSTAMALHMRLAALAPTTYNAFHLLYADRDRAFVTWSNGERIRQEELKPGLHIITERSLGGDDRARTELIRDGWRRLILDQTPPAEALGALLSQHHPEDPVGAPCVHVPSLNYGTRSSTLLWLGRSFAATHLSWAEGSPCVTPFADQEALLAALHEAGGT